MLDRWIETTISAMVTMALTGCLMGCSTNVTGETAWGFRQTSEFEFYALSKKINDGSTVDRVLFGVG